MKKRTKFVYEIRLRNFRQTSEFWASFSSSLKQKIYFHLFNRILYSSLNLFTTWHVCFIGTNTCPTGFRNGFMSRKVLEHSFLLKRTLRQTFEFLRYCHIILSITNTSHYLKRIIMISCRCYSGNIQVITQQNLYSCSIYIIKNLLNYSV